MSDIIQIELANGGFVVYIYDDENEDQLPTDKYVVTSAKALFDLLKEKIRND